jgi:hypothetical protein
MTLPQKNIPPFVPTEGRILLSEKGSSLKITVFAHSFLPSFRHKRVVVAILPTLSFPYPSSSPYRVEVSVRIPVTSFAPEGLEGKDREIFLNNLLSPRILYGEKYPEISFFGYAEGTWEGGNLRGEVGIRGRNIPWEVPYSATPVEGGWRVTFHKEGFLSQFHIERFSYLGIVYLKDLFYVDLDLILKEEGGNDPET